MTREELIKSESYWLTKWQLEVYNLLVLHMHRKKYTADNVAEKLGFQKLFIKRILAGRFEGKVSKLIELSIVLGHVPVIEFKTFNKYVKDTSR